MKLKRKLKVRICLMLTMLFLILMGTVVNVSAVKNGPMKLKKYHVRMLKGTTVDIPILQCYKKRSLTAKSSCKTVVTAKITSGRKAVRLKALKRGLVKITLNDGKEKKYCWVYVYGSKAENTYLYNLLHGKKFAVLGDSISSHKNVASGVYTYTSDETDQQRLYLPLSDQYWRIIQKIYGMSYGKTNAISGSMVSGENHGDAMANQTRIDSLEKNGTPQIILFFGGTNDYNRRETDNLPMGNFSVESEYVTQKLSTITNTNTYPDFISGYVVALRRMKAKYPKAKIIAILPCDQSPTAYVNEMKKACNYYKIRYVNLMTAGLTKADFYPDGRHPNSKGFRKIASYVLRTLYAKR